MIPPPECLNERYFRCPRENFVRIQFFAGHNRPVQREIKKMREAVIVSYARTGLAKSGRGGFNITPPMSMAAHAIKHAVRTRRRRQGLRRRRATSATARMAPPTLAARQRLLAGLPKSTAGVTVNRFCSSGLNTIAMAANYIRTDGADVHRGRRRRVHLDARRRLAEGQRSIRSSLKTVPGDLHGDDRHRRHRRRALQASAANTRTSTRWNRSAAWRPRSRPTSSPTRSSR